MGRFFNLLTVLSLLLSVVVSALWVSSYWRSMAVNWVHDNRSAGTSRLERMKISLGSLRGGFLLTFDHYDGETAEAVKDLLYYYNWHPAVEMFTESVEDIDALPNYSQLPPRSYLFMPSNTSAVRNIFDRQGG